MKNENKNIEKIEPIKDMEITKVVSFGSKDNMLVVETVASFINMMNFKNTNDKYTKYTDTGVEILPVPFDFKNTKEYKLLFAQTQKIIVDGKEVGKEEQYFEIVLNRERDVFEKALNTILLNSDSIGFTLAQREKNLLSIITKL